MDRLPLGPESEDQRAANEAARSYEERIRAKEIPTQALGQAVKRGELTEDQAVRVVRNLQTPPLVRDFKRLPIDDALKVWGKANDDERNAMTINPLPK